ncbi:MAG: helix-turn-helix domain-containing protein [Loktanella sp.]|nr:helix-turn-helix domain-containing protein [Loktanella sp.]
MTLILRHTDILRADAQVHLTRATLTAQRPRSLHQHDFFELFWVQNGTIRHHLPQGTETLAEGTIVFLSPGQSHALQGRGEHALVVSLCLHPGLIAALAGRHPSLSGHLFWTQTGLARHHRDMRELAVLNHAAVQLERSRCDTIAAEAFLLPLCAELTGETYPQGAPDWLIRACRTAQDPTVFREGAAGLVALTGKAHPHVSRSMRKFFGLTPSDYINRIRMQHAARALTTDADPISQIAADCGIPNMSHFHKLFRAAYGDTPLQYRQKLQRQVVQPS